MSKLSLIEDAKIIWACAPANYTGATNTPKYVSLKNYQRLTVIIQTGAWAGGTAAVTVTQATDVAGTGEKAYDALDYMWSDESTSGTLVKNAVTSDTFNLDTANKVYVLEIDADTLDVAGGFDCVAVAVASPGANNDYYGVTYILGGARYHAATPPTALTD
jgi:hypothetical protein